MMRVMAAPGIFPYHADNGMPLSARITNPIKANARKMAIFVSGRKALRRHGADIGQASR